MDEASELMPPGKRIDILRAEIERHQKKYSDLLQSHASLCGKIEELKDDLRKKDLQVGELQKIIKEARVRADKAWRMFEHGEECPVSQDTEDEERKAECECSTGEVEAILDILNKEVKRKDEAGNPWAPNKDYPEKPITSQIEAGPGNLCPKCVVTNPADPWCVPCPIHGKRKCEHVRVEAVGDDMAYVCMDCKAKVL